MPFFSLLQAGRGAYALDDEPNQPTPIDGSGLGLRMCPLTLNEVPSTSSSSKQGFSLLSGRSTPPALSSRSSDNRGPAPTLFVQLSYFPVGTPQTQQGADGGGQQTPMPPQTPSQPFISPFKPKAEPHNNVVHAMQGYQAAAAEAEERGDFRLPIEESPARLAWLRRDQEAMTLMQKGEMVPPYRSVNYEGHRWGAGAAGDAVLNRLSSKSRVYLGVGCCLAVAVE